MAIQSRSALQAYNKCTQLNTRWYNILFSFIHKDDITEDATHVRIRKDANTEIAIKKESGTTLTQQQLDAIASVANKADKTKITTISADTTLSDAHSGNILVIDKVDARLTIPDNLSANFLVAVKVAKTKSVTIVPYTGVVTENNGLKFKSNETFTIMKVGAKFLISP